MAKESNAENTQNPNISNRPVLASYKEEMSTEDLKRLALQLRRDIVEMTWFSGTQSSHFGGELSVVEILAVLYGRILRLNPRNPLWEERDRVILSKGHASAATYAAMAWRGFFERKRLWNEFNRLHGQLQEHANPSLPGIEAPTGSLGMGLSNGCGIAWTVKLKYKGRRAPFHVYVIMSDGECTEGQTWEAIMTAAHFRLDNLIAIIDYNQYIISGKTSSIMNLEPFEEKWANFGWHTQSVNDGHDIAQLLDALEEARRYETAPEKPRAIIARTVKGKGISFAEKDPVRWHAGHLDEVLYKQCLEELGL